MEFNGIFFNKSFLFKFNDFFFRDYLYFYIPINEDNSFREVYRIIKENTLRRRKNRNDNFSFRGFISKIIKEINFKLIVNYPL